MISQPAPLYILPSYEPPPKPRVVWPPPPTAIERRAQNALDTLGVEWEEQVEMGNYRVDLWLPEERVVLECDGCCWHACTLCGYDVGLPEETALIRAKQAQRDTFLTTQYEVRAVVHIMGHALTNDELAYLAVRGNLQHLGIRRSDWPVLGVGARRERRV